MNNLENIENIDSFNWDINRHLEVLFDEIICIGIVNNLYSDNNWVNDIMSSYINIPSDFLIYCDIRRFYIKKLRYELHDVDYNILKYYNKDYNLDMEISKLYDFFKNLKESASNTNIDDICEYFEKNKNQSINISNIPEDIETKIINEYTINFILYNSKYNPIIVRLYKNIIKYNIHKNKYSRLISLYKNLKDLDIKNKEKKIINRILNHKFNTDIIDSILYNY